MKKIKLFLCLMATMLLFFSCGNKPEEPSLSSKVQGKWVLSAMKYQNTDVLPYIDMVPFELPCKITEYVVEFSDSTDVVSFSSCDGSRLSDGTYQLSEADSTITISIVLPLLLSETMDPIEFKVDVRAQYSNGIMSFPLKNVVPDGYDESTLRAALKLLSLSWNQENKDLLNKLTDAFFDNSSIVYLSKK